MVRPQLASPCKPPPKINNATETQSAIPTTSSASPLSSPPCIRTRSNSPAPPRIRTGLPSAKSNFHPTHYEINEPETASVGADPSFASEPNGASIAILLSSDADDVACLPPRHLIKWGGGYGEGTGRGGVELRKPVRSNTSKVINRSWPSYQLLSFSLT
ncbi:MAG: hypothetical protein JWM16_486, partial [Verrucomicrobiales bacterium]|nr:hypothetical protein [Verrucomicrobiales bacterium]